MLGAELFTRYRIRFQRAGTGVSAPAAGAPVPVPATSLASTGADPGEAP